VLLADADSQADTTVYLDGCVVSGSQTEIMRLELLNRHKLSRYQAYVGSTVQEATPDTAVDSRMHVSRRRGRLQ